MMFTLRANIQVALQLRLVNNIFATRTFSPQSFRHVSAAIILTRLAHRRHDFLKPVTTTHVALLRIRVLLLQSDLAFVAVHGPTHRSQHDGDFFWYQLWGSRVISNLLHQHTPDHDAITHLSNQSGRFSVLDTKAHPNGQFSVFANCFDALGYCHWIQAG